jgi:hypothetical protein
MTVEQPAGVRRGALVAALLLAAGISVTVGVVGRAHNPVYGDLPSFGFSSVPTFKAWTATLVLILAFFQLFSSLWLYGKLPLRAAPPSWLHNAHKVNGGITFTLSLPVAAYCLYGFGFAPSPFSSRTLIHSLAGCLFYGAFGAKVLLVHSRRLPGWALPLAGGTLFTTIVVIWLTSARWYFSVVGLHG